MFTIACFSDPVQFCYGPLSKYLSNLLHARLWFSSPVHQLLPGGPTCKYSPLLLSIFRLQSCTHIFFFYINMRLMQLIVSVIVQSHQQQVAVCSKKGKEKKKNLL